MLHAITSCASNLAQKDEEVVHTRQTTSAQSYPYMLLILPQQADSAILAKEPITLAVMKHFLYNIINYILSAKLKTLSFTINVTI